MSAWRSSGRRLNSAPTSRVTASSCAPITTACGESSTLWGSGNPRLARWRLRLSELEFDVAYKPGMTHYLADSIPPFQDTALDLYGPLTRMAAGHRFILVITDRFTKLVRALPMDGTTAVDCASAVLDYWVAAYGPPDRLLSDGGPHITSHFWGQVCNLLSIEPKVTSPSHPQTNGQTERFNRTMHTILNHYVTEHPRSWDQLLGALTLA